jgi:hypothetical protein
LRDLPGEEDSSADLCEDFCDLAPILIVGCRAAARLELEQVQHHDFAGLRRLRNLLDGFRLRYDRIHFRCLLS